MNWLWICRNLESIQIFLLLFADDMVLLSNAIVGLQNQLNCLKIEANHLCLTVNLDKTNVMVIRKGGHLVKKERWFYENDEVKVTNSDKYLGVIFTTNLSLRTAFSAVCKKW